MTPPDILGTIPQWITAVGISTLIIAYWRRGVALRGLANADQVDLRDHWAKEIDRCTREIGMLRDRVAQQDRQYVDFQREAHIQWEEGQRHHQECIDERNQLRLELEGLKLQFKAASADRVIAMEARSDPPSPLVMDAARRVKDITEGK